MFANKERRDARQKQTAEIFTPPHLVLQMLDKLPPEVWQEEKTFCDPACGTGNMLIQVLWTKISQGNDPLKALQCIFGADIMPDNIQECRTRLLKIASIFQQITEQHVRAVLQNIVYINTTSHPKGSLDYNFNFNTKLNEKNVKEWLNHFNKMHENETKLTVIPEPAPNDLFA